MRVAGWAAWAVALGAVGYGEGWYRLQHPELTETQLLLALWPLWLGASVVCLVLGLLGQPRHRHQN